MATGGTTVEEDLQYILFSIFLDIVSGSLINKQPRLLSCGHTFCTPPLN